MANNQNQTIVISSTDTTGEAGSDADHTTSANVFTYLESILVPGDNVTVVANNQNDTVVISSTDTNTDTTYSELTRTQAASNTSMVAGLASGRRLWDAVKAFEDPTPNLANRPAPTQTEVFDQLETILSASGAAGVVANNTNQMVVISSTDTDTTYFRAHRSTSGFQHLHGCTGLASGRRLWDAVRAYESEEEEEVIELTEAEYQALGDYEDKLYVITDAVIDGSDGVSRSEVFDITTGILTEGSNITLVANNQSNTIVISASGDGMPPTLSEIFAHVSNIILDGDNTTVTVNSNDTITIASTDTDTTYSELNTSHVVSNTDSTAGLITGRRLWESVRAFESATPNLANRPGTQSNRGVYPA